MKLIRILPPMLAVAVAMRAERINHEGRILGAEPVVTAPTLFNTAAADAIVAAMQIMPGDSSWNEDISARPLLSNSAAMIAQIRSDLAANRRTLRAFHEMNYVLVPDAQPLVPIAFLDYPGESDPSPYPIPPNMPVETWPRETGSLTLAQWQQDVAGTGGDRHSIVVAPGAGAIWETWQARLVGTQWRASNGAKFNLRSNALRPAGWTSGDAAGLPMFPALVRYDECVRGMVEHAMRIVVRQSRREYIYPATHFASSIPASQANVPAMGQRVRLKANFTIPENWTIFEKAVCRGLKKYGALVADNGNFFSISVTPDDRYPANAFDNLASIDVDNFEVVQTTGPNEGPRSPGAPVADAGADFVATANSPVALSGAATGAGAAIQWTKYSGPGTVTFGNAAQAVTTASFSQPGTYTLLLSAKDGIHAVAYDAVVVVVADSAPSPGGGSARLYNLSTRSLVGVGGEVQIAGFTIGEGAPRKVVIRAAGPALAAFGVPNLLADPTLAVFSGDTVLAQNDNWEPTLAAEFARVGAPEWQPGSTDAALVLTLPPGGYTAHVRGRNDGTGVALVEVFEAESPAGAARLTNISTRARVGTSGEIQIGGFVIAAGPRKVLIRASGPGLGPLGVDRALSDPVLTVYAGSSMVAQNDNWDTALAADFARVGAFGWTTGSRDAALVLTLPAGAYSAQVSGGDGGTGVALVEVYEEN